MKIVLIGGGDIGAFGKKSLTKEIDKNILKFYGRTKDLNVLFIPTASHDNQEYCDAFFEKYRSLGCKTRALRLYSNPSYDEVDEMLFWSHIIYVGGGNTVEMLKKWEECDLVNRLKIVGNTGTLLSGLSAGASCWCKKVITDSLYESGEFSVIDGLGFLDINFCPHFSNKEGRKEFTLKTSKENNEMYFGLDDYTALFFDNDNFQGFNANEKSKIYLIDNGEVRFF